MRFRPPSSITLSAILSALTYTSAHAATITEDFTSTTQWDSASSTGLWNGSTHEARAAVFINGDPTRPVSFGDGRDGVVNTGAGYHFDTDAHPLYQFQSLTISGGSISVTGKNPLIIQSLGAVTIASPISVRGGNGQNGSTGSLTTSPTGGTGVAGGGWGGAGGNVTAGPTAHVGTDGLKPDGVTDDTSATGGAIQSNGTNSSDQLLSTDFDTGPLIAGGGGGGGSTIVGTSATGGGGGAGGGVLKISALGAISVAAVDANGGDAGQNAGTCSGYGSPGNGGGVWLQSLSSVSTSTEPLVFAGTVTSTGCGVAVTPQDGTERADTPAGVTPSGWVSSPLIMDSSPAVPTQTYTIQSKGYDLHTLNALFSGPAVITQTLNGGTIDVTYSGSSDGTTYSAETTDLTTLSNQGYRYVRFKISITTAGSAGASPVVTRVSLPYTEKGVADLDLSLGFGCGSLAMISRGGGSSGPQGGSKSTSAQAAEFALLLLSLTGILALAKRANYRRVADENRFDRNAFPA